LNITNRKLNFYLGYSANYANIQIKNLKTQNYSDTMLVSYLIPDNNDFNLIYGRMSHNVNLGTDYYFSPKHTLSFESQVSILPKESNVILSDFDVITTANNNTIDDFTTSSQTFTNSKSFNNSLFYVGNFNDRNSLNMSYTFSIFENETDNYMKQGTFEMNQFGEDSKLFSNFNSEFNHTFSSKVSLNLGYGNTWKQLENKFYDNFGTTEQSIQEFDYNELRNQLYSYLSYKPFKKLSFKAGLATENTIVTYNDIQKPYWIFQPHADIRYSPIENVLDIKLKYRSNSRYPTISQTNPFTTIIDWQTVSTGNPDLEPEVENKISMRMNVMGGLISIEPYYNFSDNSIIQVLNQQTTGIWELTYENAASQWEYGLKALLTIPIGKVIFFQNNFRIFKENISYNGDSHNLTDWTLNSNLIYRNQKYGTMFGILYQSQLRKAITWQGYVSYGNDFWGIFFQQPMFKEKLNLMMIYGIPTNFGVDFNQGTYIETNLYQEYNNTDLSIMKNMLMIQVSYRFTKGKEVKKLDKNINIEDEIDQKSVF
jgi:Outer membrane protein beta-barrel family